MPLEILLENRTSRAKAPAGAGNSSSRVSRKARLADDDESRDESSGYTMYGIHDIRMYKLDYVHPSVLTEVPVLRPLSRNQKVLAESLPVDKKEVLLKRTLVVDEISKHLVASVVTEDIINESSKSTDEVTINQEMNQTLDTFSTQAQTMKATHKIQSHQNLSSKSDSGFRRQLIANSSNRTNQCAIRTNYLASQMTPRGTAERIDYAIASAEFHKHDFNNELNELESSIKRHLNKEKQRHVKSPDNRNSCGRDGTNREDVDDGTSSEDEGEGYNVHGRSLKLSSSSATNKKGKKGKIGHKNLDLEPGKKTIIDEEAKKLAAANMTTSEKLEIELTKLDKRLTQDLMRKQKTKQVLMLNKNTSVTKERLPVFRTLVKSILDGDKLIPDGDGTSGMSGTVNSFRHVPPQTVASTSGAAILKSSSSKASLFSQVPSQSATSQYSSTRTRTTVKSSSSTIRSDIIPTNHNNVALVVNESMVILRDRKLSFQNAMSTNPQPNKEISAEMAARKEAIQKEVEEKEFQRILYLDGYTTNSARIPSSQQQQQQQQQQEQVEKGGVSESLLTEAASGNEDGTSTTPDTPQLNLDITVQKTDQPWRHSNISCVVIEKPSSGIVDSTHSTEHNASKHVRFAESVHSGDPSANEGGASDNDDDDCDSVDSVDSAHNDDHSPHTATEPETASSPLHDAITARLQAQKKQQMLYQTEPFTRNIHILPTRPTSGPTTSSAYRRGRHMSHSEALALSKPTKPSASLFDDKRRPSTADMSSHRGAMPLSSNQMHSPQVSSKKRPGTAVIVATPPSVSCTGTRAVHSAGASSGGGNSRKERFLHSQQMSVQPASRAVSALTQKSLNSLQTLTSNNSSNIHGDDENNSDVDSTTSSFLNFEVDISDGELSDNGTSNNDRIVNGHTQKSLRPTTATNTLKSVVKTNDTRAHTQRRLSRHDPPFTHSREDKKPSRPKPARESYAQVPYKPHRSERAIELREKQQQEMIETLENLSTLNNVCSGLNDIIYNDDDVEIDENVIETIESTIVNNRYRRYQLVDVMLDDSIGAIEKARLESEKRIQDELNSSTTMKPEAPADGAGGIAKSKTTTTAADSTATDVYTDSVVHHSMATQYFVSPVDTVRSKVVSRLSSDVIESTPYRDREMNHLAGIQTRRLNHVAVDAANRNDIFVALVDNISPSASPTRAPSLVGSKQKPNTSAPNKIPLKDPNQQFQLISAKRARRAVEADVKTLYSLSDKVAQRSVQNAASLLQTWKETTNQMTRLQKESTQQLKDKEFSLPEKLKQRSQQLAELNDAQKLRTVPVGTTTVSAAIRQKEEMQKQLQGSITQNLRESSEHMSQNEKHPDSFFITALRPNTGNSGAAAVGAEKTTTTTSSSLSPQFNNAHSSSDDHNLELRKFNLTAKNLSKLIAQHKELDNKRGALKSPGTDNHSWSPNKYKNQPVSTAVALSDVINTESYERYLKLVLKDNEKKMESVSKSVILSKKWFVTLLMKLRKYKKRTINPILPVSLLKFISTLKQIIIMNVPLTKEALWKIIEGTIEPHEHKLNLVYTAMQSVCDVVKIDCVEIYTYLKTRGIEYAPKLMMNVKRVKKLRAMMKSKLKAQINIMSMLRAWKGTATSATATSVAKTPQTVSTSGNVVPASLTRVVEPITPAAAAAAAAPSVGNSAKTETTLNTSSVEGNSDKVETDEVNEEARKVEDSNITANNNDDGNGNNDDQDDDEDDLADVSLSDADHDHDHDQDDGLSDGGFSEVGHYDDNDDGGDEDEDGEGLDTFDEEAYLRR